MRLQRAFAAILFMLGLMTSFAPAARAYLPKETGPETTQAQVTVGPCSLTYFPLGAISNNQVTWYAYADVICTEEMTNIIVGVQLSVSPNGQNPASYIVRQSMTDCDYATRCPLVGQLTTPPSGPHPQSTFGHARGAMEFVKLNGQTVTVPFPNTSFSCVSGYGGGMGPQP